MIIKSFRLFSSVIFFACVVFALITLSGCKKEGPGGDSKINFTVKHHNNLISGATVYIKYGATEFPGEDVSVYDDEISTGSGASGSFSELYKGDYYLFATGVDSSIMLPVAGGVGIKIEKNGDIVDTDIPVTETH